MAWPPTIPPATRANATLQADLHPQDHNQISAALTEIVGRIDSRLLAWTPADNPTSGIGSSPHSVIALNFTAPEAGLVEARGQITLAWGSGGTATDLIGLDMTYDDTSLGTSTCFTCIFGSGTAVMAVPLAMFFNVTAGAHVIKWRLYRVTGTGTLFASSQGSFGAVMFYGVKSPV